MGDYSTQMGTDILSDIGAPLTAENYKLLAAWAQAEGGTAKFNPFNTTQPAPGATNFNSVGVKDYTSYQQGVQATVQTLNNGNYPGILSSLKAGTSAQMTAQAIANSPWGTGALVEKVLGGGGPNAVPDTTPDAGSGGTSDSNVPNQSGTTTVTCYWKLNLGVADFCADPILWVSLGLISTGAFLLGAALMAIGSGHSHPAARAIVSTIGPTAVASKAVRAAKVAA